MLTPVAWFDSSPVIDCTQTNIPKSSSLPLEVITSLSRVVNEIHTIQSTGAYIGVYTGASGHEQLLCIVGGSPAHPISVLIPGGTRISLRNMDDTDITSGSICCQFLGFIRPPKV